MTEGIDEYRKTNLESELRRMVDSFLDDYGIYTSNLLTLKIKNL